MLNLKSSYSWKFNRRKIFIKVLSMVLVLTLLVGTSFTSEIIVMAQEVYDFGKCGENLTWTVDSMDPDDGSLSISGQGNMYDYSDETSAPWKQYKGRIHRVSLDSGMTSIGDYAFNSFDRQRVRSIDVPNGVTRIGKHAFSNVSSTVSIPDSVVTIDSYAFSSSSFTNSKLPSNLQFIGDYAFQSTNISSLTIPNTVTYIGNRAFKNCGSLNEMYFNYTIDQINNLDSNAISSASFDYSSPLKLIFSDDDTKAAFDAKFPDLSSKTISPLKLTGLKDIYNLRSTETIQVQNNRPGEIINYTIDNSEVASINSDGVISLLSLGSFTISASIGQGNSEYNKASFGPITVLDVNSCGDN